MPEDLSTQILVQIRDELRGMREAQDRTNERLDRTNERLDRVIQEQIRHATAIVALEQGQHELVAGQTAIVSELKRLNDRIDNVLTGALGETVRAHEDRISSVENRLVAIEKRVGGGESR